MEKVWRHAGLDRLTARVEKVSTSESSVVTRTRYAAADAAHWVSVEETWQLSDGELWLRLDIVPSAAWDIIWPRVGGVRFDLPGSVDGVSWFGAGPRESYPDSMHATFVGSYSAGIDELSVNYAKPQETGHRSAVRTLDLQNHGASWLQLDASRTHAAVCPASRSPGTQRRRSRPQHIRTSCRQARAATCTSMPPSTGWVPGHADRMFGRSTRCARKHGL